MIVSAASLGTPRSHSLIGGTISPSSNTRGGGATASSRAPRRRCRRGGRRPARRRRPRRAVHVGEHRHRHAQVGQVADAALGEVDVVVEEDVAGAASSRSGSRGRPGAPAPSTSGRSACAACRSWMPARKSCASRIIGERDVRPMAVSTSFSIAASVPATISTSTGSRRRVRWHGRHASSRVSSRLPCASTAAVKPGCTGTVEPNSSITAGPRTTSPAPRPLAGRRSAWPTQSASKNTGRDPVTARSVPPAPGVAAAPAPDGGSARCR